MAVLIVISGVETKKNPSSVNKKKEKFHLLISKSRVRLRSRHHSVVLSVCLVVYVMAEFFNNIYSSI